MTRTDTVTVANMVTKMSSSGWSVGYQEGWAIVLTDTELDLEVAANRAVLRRVEMQRTMLLFPPDGSAGRTINEALIVCGIRMPAPKCTPTRLPLSGPGMDRAWFDGPGAPGDA